MSYDDVTDPASEAALAATALEQSLAALQQVVVLAGAAGASAATAAAAQAIIADLVTKVMVPYRWTGTVLQLKLGDVYGPGVDLEGSEGPTGPAPVIAIGKVSEGDFAVTRQPGSPDVAPVLDFTLARGNAGWTPVLANVVDGSRIVQRVVDWTGGQGTKPTTGLYVGATGFVPAIANAVDVRGPVSGVGIAGTPTATHLAVFTNATTVGDGGAISAFGQSLIAAATAFAVKQLLGLVVGDISGAAPLVSPALTGTPTAPTAATADSSTTLATTAFVHALITALIGTAPAALDTLGEIATQLANDESAASALTTAVAGKLSKANNLSDLSNIAAARTTLGLVVGTTVQAWDSDLDAIAALSTTAYGRALLTLASAAALTAAVNALIGDTGSGGTKGLVPAPAAGDAAAGKFLRADATWAAPASSFPVSGISAKTAAYPIVAADKGVMFDLTGSFNMTLPAVSGASPSAPLYYHWRKRDGSGVCTVTCAGSDTFANGRTSVSLYQEHMTLVSFGGPWYSPPGGRQIETELGVYGFVNGAAGVQIGFCFGDGELRDIEFDFEALTGSASTSLTIALLQAGLNATLEGQVIAGVSSTASATAISGSSFGAGPSMTATASIGGAVLMRNVQSTVAKGIEFTADFTGAGSSRISKGAVTTTGALSALSLTVSSGSISGIYRGRGKRA